MKAPRKKFNDKCDVNSSDSDYNEEDLLQTEVDEMCESMTKYFEWAFVTNSNVISSICVQKPKKLNPPKIVTSKISSISAPKTNSESSYQNVNPIASQNNCSNAE